MTSADWGWVGGIASVAIGLAGGIAGTYFSLKNTRTEEERGIMIKFIVVFWSIGLVLLTLITLAAFDVVPEAVYWVAWILFMCFMGPSIALVNRRLARARGEDGPAQGPPEG